MNQKDAVYEAIRRLKPHEVDKEGKPVTLTKSEKKVVEQKLFDGFRSKKIQYNSELPSDDKLAMYVSGLVSNWLRKDRRLNGNRTYQPGRTRSSYVAPTVPVARIPEDELRAIRSVAAATTEDEEVTVYVVRRRPGNHGEERVVQYLEEEPARQ